MTDALVDGWTGCGRCGGPLYFETCDMENGTGHDWALASECQHCGYRHVIESGCIDCNSSNGPAGI